LPSKADKCSGRVRHTTKTVQKIKPFNENKRATNWKKARKTVDSRLLCTSAMALGLNYMPIAPKNYNKRHALSK